MASHFRFRDDVDDIENAMFPLFVTPITLAARLHRSDIIELICKEGHSDIHPISGMLWLKITLIITVILMAKYLHLFQWNARSTVTTVSSVRSGKCLRACAQFKNHVGSSRYTRRSPVPLTSCTLRAKTRCWRRSRCVRKWQSCL